MERGMADSVFVEASELGRRAQSDEAVEVLAPEAGPREGGGEGGEGGSSARVGGGGGGEGMSSKLVVIW